MTRRARRLSLGRLVWIHLWAKPMLTGLNLVLLMLGFGAITVVMLASQQIEQQLQRDLAGIDLVVGAKGSPLQLILAGVFHLDTPTGNIPASAEATLRAHPLVAQVVPLAMGDSAHGHRIVGTSGDYLTLLGARLAQGQWQDKPLSAVIGAEVARQRGWRLGQRFVGSHGLGEGGQAHNEQPFTVTGVLAPTGGAVDGLILTPVRSVWLVHEAHGAHEVPPAAPEQGARSDDHADHNDHEGDEHAHDADHVHSDHANSDHAEPPRELTMLLVRYRSPLAAVSLPRWVNTQGPLQSASPALEAARLFRMVGVGIDVMQGFGVVLLLVAGLSVFIALTHAVRERQGELATMRLLGASPARVSLTVALEALALALAGCLLGVLLGHGLIEALGQVLQAQQSVRLTGQAWSAHEAWLPALAVGLALLACLGPTWRAYRTDMLGLLQSR